MRLDAYLAQYFPEHSRSAWQKYIAAGYVKVNGEVVSSNKLLLGEDDEVTADTRTKPGQLHIDMPVVYEDENVVVIDKPAGVLSHAKGGIVEEATVADFFKSYTSYGKDTNRPGIIHRLDRATSGIMIGVKNAETAKLLQKQFSDRKAKKTYMAVIEGTPKESEARIELPIERNPSKPSQFRVGVNGKSASTTYKVLSSNGRYSLVELKPTTGRTHQLRVHMAHIGHPIVGDIVYGQDSTRMFLHATRLELTLPGGERKVFEAPLPALFREMVKL